MQSKFMPPLRHRQVTDRYSGMKNVLALRHCQVAKPCTLPFLLGGNYSPSRHWKVKKSCPICIYRAGILVREGKILSKPRD